MATTLAPALPPALAEWLKGYNELFEDLERKGFVYTPEITRDGLARLTANLVTTSPDVAHICDASVDGPQGSVPVRIYHSSPDQALPVLVYFHGGGHMAGSVEVYDPICRKLALATKHIIVSVEYRLAPEHPYPQGLNDAEAVLRQVFDLLESQDLPFEPHLALGGDSAGGAMTATLSHRLQDDEEVDIRQQLLVYPSLDYTMQHPSLEENARGYLLHTDKIGWYFDHYLQNEEDRSAVSPLNLTFTENLPETLIVTAEFDPLRDEAYAYVERLVAAGVAHRHLHYADQIHAFLNMEDVSQEACENFYRVAGEFFDRNRRSLQGQ